MSKTELSDPITLRLPVEVLGDIERIARTAQRTRSWVMVRALKLYLASEGREILEIAVGMEELAAGKSEDIDDVIADLERIVRGDAA